MRRFLRYGSVLLVLVFVGIAVAAAQAAATKKLFDANVHVTNQQDPQTFTLTLTDDPKSQQTIGSANFTAPAGFQLVQGSVATTRGGWTATVIGSVVQFRSTSNPLTASSTDLGVSANVTVSSPSLPTTCASATWLVDVKQSNDFSGQPGNGFVSASASDTTPLGSFTIDQISDVADVGFPTVLDTLNPAFTPFDFKTTAYDSCGVVKQNYTGASLDYSFLTGATFFSVSANKAITKTTYPTTAWSGGVADVHVSPVVTETPNSLTVTDPTTGIFKQSNVFDVVDFPCTTQSSLVNGMCQWQNPKKSITATTAPPGADLQSIGIGFNENDNVLGTFTCAGRTSAIGQSIINVNPHLPADTTYQVTLTFTKQASGSGPASGFVVCLVDSMPQQASDWLAATVVTACPSSTPVAADAPCVLSQKRITGGALQIVLFLNDAAGDPWGGVG
jgi:hypothetical protein